MSEPERQADAKRWLRYASEDLRNAKLIMEQGGTPRGACFLAQQAAEKAIKAALIFIQEEMPYVHNLNALRNRLPGEWELREKPPDLSKLTLWAIEARYPGELPEAAEEDAREAVEQAQEVYEKALKDVKRHGYDPGDEGTRNETTEEEQD